MQVPIPKHKLQNSHFLSAKKMCVLPSSERWTTTRCTTSGPRERGHHDNVQEQKGDVKMNFKIILLTVFMNLDNLYTYHKKSL